MSTIKLEGQLEIDPSRGVIYFHSSEGVNGITTLRVCGLSVLKPYESALQSISLIDITISEKSPAVVSITEGQKT